MLSTWEAAKHKFISWPISLFQVLFYMFSSESFLASLLKLQPDFHGSFRTRGDVGRGEGGQFAEKSLKSALRDVIKEPLPMRWPKNG